MPVSTAVRMAVDMVSMQMQDADTRATHVLGNRSQPRVARARRWRRMREVRQAVAFWWKRDTEWLRFCTDRSCGFDRMLERSRVVYVLGLKRVDRESTRLSY